MELNEKIRTIRKAKGYTQEMLAEQLGVSRQAIAKWENGYSFPSTENLILLSQILDIDVRELIENKKVPLLKRPVARGSITIYDDVLSYMNRDRHDVEEKYSILLMSNIQCHLGSLSFTYGNRTITIALGKDKTDWTSILTNIQKGIMIEAEPVVDVEDYIINHFNEKQLVEATKYYLSMCGGRRKDAVEAVKLLFYE